MFRTSQIKSIVAESSSNTIGINECDTDADTCCLGKNFIGYKYTQRTAVVYAYDKSYTPATNVPIVTGATAYDDPVSGMTYALLFHEVLYYGEKMDHSLFNSNQIHMYGIPVWDNPFDRDRPFSIQVSDEVEIQLSSKGTKIYFKTRSPTESELQNCPKLQLTSDVTWNPSEVTLQETSRDKPSKLPFIKRIKFNNNDRYQYREDMSINDIMLNEISSSLTGINEDNPFQLRVEDTPYIRTYVSSERHNQVSADNISEILGIGPNKAKQMLRITRQRGTRSAILPIGRRYRTDRMYDVKRLNGKFATDTLYGNVISLRGNKASQIYSNKCGFKADYHISKVNNEQVGQSLNDFIFEFGAPN